MIWGDTIDKAAFTTLGCKVNQYETEAMIELFKKSGYEIVDFDDYADVYVINTCTVTSFGDKKSRQMIRKARNMNDEAVIAVVGCYSQVSPDKVSEIPGVNIILGTNDRKKIVEMVGEYKSSGVPIRHVGNIMDIRKFEQLDIAEYRDKTRAFLKIQDGCNRFCSYCLIPYARGPVRSRDPGEIIDEVKRLASGGFKEVILSGIHVASYGNELGTAGLTDIIEKISAIEGIKRIRIGSVEPTYFTREVVDRLRKVPSLCRHFHLSLQSGCDETLKRMNRRYTSSEYENIVNILREVFPGVSITTDIITGFPGETDEEFSITYEYLRKLKLSKMHIFKYSKREGTPAARLTGMVPSETKEKRSKMLIELNMINERLFIEDFIGKKLEVLYEQSTRGIEGYMEGYTDNYISVRSPGGLSLTGEIAETVLISNCGVYAKGRIV